MGPPFGHAGGVVHATTSSRTPDAVARPAGGSKRRPIVPRAGKCVNALGLRQTRATIAHVIRAYRLCGMREEEGDNLRGLMVVPPLVHFYAVQATPTREVSCRY